MIGFVLKFDPFSPIWIWISDPYIQIQSEPVRLLINKLDGLYLCLNLSLLVYTTLLLLHL